MNIREEFNNQWRDIQNIVLSDAKSQIKFNGKVDSKTLTEKLRQETSKWQRGVLVRGVLYNEIARNNSSHAILFAEEAEKLKFIEPKHNKIPSTWWITDLCLIPMMLLLVWLHLQYKYSLIEQILYPSILFVFLNALCMPIKNRKKECALNALLQDIENQMQDMKSDLERFL